MVTCSSAGVQIMMATVLCGCEGVQVVTLSDTLGLHLQIGSSCRRGGIAYFDIQTHRYQVHKPELMDLGVMQMCV